MTAPPSLPWSIFDTLPEPVLVIDAKRMVTAANRAALALLPGASVGSDLSLALRQPGVLAAAAHALSGGAAEDVEITVSGPAPQTFQARAFSLDGDDGPRAVVTLHDITAERRSEGMRSDFVANVSHELRSPLASLLGFVETLRGPAKDDRAAHEKFLGIMQSDAERMARLIDDLLSLSRVEADKHIRPMDTVSLATVLGHVTESARLRAAERNVRIDLELEDGLPTVPGDPDQLIQVFQNLVDNAVKYGRGESTVTVTARRGDDTIVVSVTDQGDGISSQDLPRLTERFYRVDKARSRALGGTGLGLAIVKHIIGRHRGTLAIDSEEGVGSTFTVRLPVTS